MTLPAPGLHLGVPEALYRSWDAVSQSTLKAGETMADVKHAMDNPSEPTREQVVGTALHWAFFEPARYAAGVVTSPKFDMRKKGEEDRVNDFYAANEGKLVLQGDEGNQVDAWADALREHPGASYLFDLPGEMEASMLWRDKETGEMVKGRLDKLPAEGPIIDLKTCASVETRLLTAAIRKFGYHFQAATYCEGVEMIGRGMRDYVLVCLQKKAPYHVRTIRLERDWIIVGQQMYRKRLAEYAKAKKSGIWPGYSEVIEPFYAPSYLLRDVENLEVELTL